MQQSRLVFALPFAGCVIAMAVALQYFQNILGLAPCPLCVVQRLVFIVLGLIFLLATLHNPQNVMRNVYKILTMLTALIGASISGWHVYLQNLPPDQTPECGPGLDFMMEVMPLTEVITKIFTGSGECSEILWQFLGLSIPAWTLVAFAAFAIYSLVLLVKRW